MGTLESKVITSYLEINPSLLKSYISYINLILIENSFEYNLNIEVAN